MKIFSNFISENDPLYNGLKLIDKPITFFYDYIPQNIEQIRINPINIIMLHEPNEFFGMHNWVLANYQLFNAILTWSSDIINNCDNAVLFHHNCNYLDSNYIDLFKDPTKKFEVSFLSGVKTLVEGHKLRQEIFKLEDQINIPKKWFQVLDDFNWDDFNKGGTGRPSNTLEIDGKIVLPQVEGKKILFKESMFHVCVENVKHNNWYTEKISEAFLTKTIPVYWGCPNISDFGYDERGIIRFENLKELTYILNSLTEGKYSEMKPFIDYNYEVAKNETRFQNKLELFFENLIELNNL